MTRQERIAHSARLAEDARIEEVENHLRMVYNATARTEDLLPYHNEAHIALVCDVEAIIKEVQAA